MSSLVIPTGDKVLDMYRIESFVNMMDPDSWKLTNWFATDLESAKEQHKSVYPNETILSSFLVKE